MNMKVKQLLCSDDALKNNSSIIFLRALKRFVYELDISNS